VGTFFHPITLIGPSRERETLDALVDTGTLFGIFPTKVLERLGIAAYRTTRLPVAGDVRERRLGHAEAELDGSQMPIMCLFGEDDELARIGRHTLDSFLLDVDEERQELVPKVFQLVEHF
jgi:predicted aspartyl protease